MAEFLGVPIEKIHTVRTGLRLDRFATSTASRPRDPFVIGYLSRITPGKGLDVLVEAVRILCKDGARNVRLKVAGQRLDRRFWRSIERAVAAAGLADRFEYCGEPDLTGKLDFLRACCAFSVPSRYPEVRGLAVMEAIALGVPVVLPDLGVFTELIERTGGGSLFPAGNAERLAAELAAFIDNPHRADDLGLAGREAIRVHYSNGHMAERTLELYSTVVEEKSA
jgi:glycosyltransferase involved in cell wall biosynthesis